MDAQGFMTEMDRYAREGWRLLLINTTSVLPGPDGAEGALDMSWSFEKGGKVEHVRRRVTVGEAVPSVSGLFGAAFLYENELHDLFGLELTGLTVDFKGQLYRTSQKVPFSPRAIRERLAAKGKAS